MACDRKERDPKVEARKLLMWRATREKRALICFTGYSGALGQVDPEQFRDFALGLNLFDRVRVLKPSYRQWKDPGFQNREFSRHLQRVRELSDSGVTLYYFGTSIGGFAALRLAAESDCVGVLATKPPIDISQLRGGKGASCDFTSLHSVRSRLPTTLALYSRDDEGASHHYRQATFFQGLRGAEVSILDSFDVPTAVENGNLAGYFERLIEKSGPRTQEGSI